MNSEAPDSRAAFSMEVGESICVMLPMPMFSAIVRPSNSPVFWNRTVIWRRKIDGSYSLTLISLMNNSPSVGLASLVSNLAKVDFPAPL